MKYLCPIEPILGIRINIIKYNVQRQNRYYRSEIKIKCDLNISFHSIVIIFIHSRIESNYVRVIDLLDHLPFSSAL